MEKKNVPEELICLFNKVEELKKSNEQEIVKKLQEIERKLLCQYQIVIGENIIIPILVEAYYRSDAFNDKYTHDSRRQKNRFGKIYIHEKGRGGIDLCLSDGCDYALSFLIKNSVVKTQKSKSNHQNETFLKQTQLFDFLKNDNSCGYNTCYDKEGKKYYELKTECKIKKISKNENEQNDIVYLKRKGLGQEENEYRDCELAAFLLKSMRKYPLTFEGGKECAVKKYLNQEYPNADRETWERECKSILKNNLRQYFDEHFK